MRVVSVLRSPPRRVIAILGAALLCMRLTSATAQDDTQWYSLDVPGGSKMLSRLGVPENHERGTVMIELIRRLQFSTSSKAALHAALRHLSAQRGDQASAGVALPLPLPAESWSNAVFGRPVAPDRLFIEILNDENARLIYHGAAGLDAATRQWLRTEHDLLRWLAQDRDALRAFAWFAPAISVAGGKVTVPGGAAAERRWSALVEAPLSRPDQFVRRLLAHNRGRTAGLYFVFWAADAARRDFMLAQHLPVAHRDGAFRRLVSGFAACYPPQATAYPFALRSHDAAYLLLEIALDDTGRLRGPASHAFWQEVFAGSARGERATADDAIDAAWMVETLCNAPADDREGIFVTFLVASRVFDDAAAPDLRDAATALAARRAYPALFISLDLAGVQSARTYGAAARHAAALSRIDHAGRRITALRQFQGAVALTVSAAEVDTVGPMAAAALIESLSAVPLHDGEYEGRIADWLDGHWIPAARSAVGSTDQSSVEDLIAGALAGTADASPRRIHWEGVDYVVDLAGTARQELRAVRKRQGGASVDIALALNRGARALREPGISLDRVARLKSDLGALAPQLRGSPTAEEYAGDGLDVARLWTRIIGRLSAITRTSDLGNAAAIASDLTMLVDFLLAHALPSWAYAPYLGGADSGALVGGDGSLRHRLGVRTMGRSRAEQPWQLAVSPAARGSMSGSILGIQAGLASWSLRRLSVNAVPAAPVVDGNDAIPLALTAALSRPRRLRDVDMAALAGAQRHGAALIAQARSYPQRLDDLAARAAISPWRRAVLPWMVREEPDEVEAQFSALQRARLGRAALTGLAAWGSVSLSTGSLRLRMPAATVPEAFAGRGADGIVCGQSVDLMLRVAALLTELQLPASLAAPVLSYAMREFLDRVHPVHAADLDAFSRQAGELTRAEVEDYVGALAALGPLRPLTSP